MSEQHQDVIESDGIARWIRRKAGALKRLYGRFDFVSKVSVWTIFAIVTAAILASIIAPHDPHGQNYDVLAIPPFTDPSYLFGTDRFGRDILSRTIYGGRVSLMVAITAVSFAAVVGCTWGAISGFVGGWTDEALMRFADVVLSFPALVLALALIAMFGPSMRNLILVIGIVYSPQYARLLRSTVLSVKEETFVEAVRNTGLSERKILTRHVVPNALTPVLVQASFHIARAILTESALSFLGLGVRPPTSSWGIMIANARSGLPEIWWPMFIPGLAIMITVLAFNLVGDSLRDELDPHEATGAGSE